MSEHKQGFPWLLIAIFISVMVTVAFLAFPTLRVLPMVFFSVNQIKREESKMQTPEFSSQVGHSLAVYCQSGKAIFPTGFVGNAWLPKPVRDLGPSYVTITETNAEIVMGGGFYHYGYSLERAQSSVPASNVWELRLLREETNPKLVSTFTTAASETIPISNFIANTLSEYDELSKKKKNEYEIRWLVQNRVAFLLQFDRSKIREARMQASRDFPHRWWPRLTLAIVDSSSGREYQAAREFSAWAQTDPSYSRYMCLAYYYEVMGKPGPQAEAIEKAIKCPIIDSDDSDDDDANTECRGYWAGIYAFRNAEYKTVIDLCDALLPSRINGDYAKAGLRDLRSAAVAAETGTVPVLEPSQQILKFNPYDHVSIESLRAH